MTPPRTPQPGPADPNPVDGGTGHIAEAELVLYQLHEASSISDAMQAHLETCPACAALADSIAETLRIFSAPAVPAPNVDRAWRQLRPQLTPLATSSTAIKGTSRFAPARLLRFAPVAGLALAAILLLTASLFHGRRAPGPATVSHINRPGPLTDHPVDPALAAHLDSAERLLTEVSHTSTPLDPATREQAQTLLAHNAFFTESARSSGDLADAAVLEKRGRVLTTLNHPSSTDTADGDHGWHLRFEITTNGLLLDLRILRQNDAHTQPSTSISPQEITQ